MVYICWRWPTLVLGLVSIVHSAQETIVTINTAKGVKVVSDKFLSLMIDPSTLLSGNNLRTMMTLNMARSLAPAYLRLAGPDSNHYKFQSLHLKDDPNKYMITEKQWNDVNDFAIEAGLDLVVSLNIMDRIEGVWNSRSSMDLIAYSNKMNYSVSWQLGYELQELKCNISGAQLGRDVNNLRHIINAYPRYRNSILLGPDITRIDTREDVKFLRKYFHEADPALSGITWHMELTGQLNDSDKLQHSLENLSLVREKLTRTLGRATMKKPLWIGEKSMNTNTGHMDALTWAHRLGAMARMGVYVIMKQPDLGTLEDPSPEFWVSLLHKNMVGQIVLDTKQADKTSDINLYCHCHTAIPGAITFFAVNYKSTMINVTLKIGSGVKQGIELMHQYLLTFTNDGKEVQFRIPVTNLNGQPLVLGEDGSIPDLSPEVFHMNHTSMVSLPPMSVGFWVMPDVKAKPCFTMPRKSSSKKEILHHFQNHMISTSMNDNGKLLPITLSEESRQDSEPSTEFPKLNGEVKSSNVLYSSMITSNFNDKTNDFQLPLNKLNTGISQKSYHNKNKPEKKKSDLKVRKRRFITEKSRYVIPGLEPDIFQLALQKNPLNKIEKKSRADRQPKLNKKPRYEDKYQAYKRYHHIRSGDTGEIISEEREYLYPHAGTGRPIYLRHDGASYEEINKDYDYIGRDDNMYEDEEFEAIDPVYYHAPGEYFEKLQIDNIPSAKKFSGYGGELWEAETYALEKVHKAEEETKSENGNEDDNIVKEETPNEEEDHKAKDAATKMLDTYFESTKKNMKSKKGESKMSEEEKYEKKDKDNETLKKTDKNDKQGTRIINNDKSSDLSEPINYVHKKYSSNARDRYETSNTEGHKRRSWKKEDDHEGYSEEHTLRSRPSIQDKMNIYRSSRGNKIEKDTQREGYSRQIKHQNVPESDEVYSRENRNTEKSMNIRGKTRKTRESNEHENSSELKEEINKNRKINKNGDEIINETSKSFNITEKSKVEEVTTRKSEGPEFNEGGDKLESTGNRKLSDKIKYRSSEVKSPTHYYRSKPSAKIAANLYSEEEEERPGRGFSRRTLRKKDPLIAEIFSDEIVTTEEILDDLRRARKSQLDNQMRRKMSRGYRESRRFQRDTSKQLTGEEKVTENNAKKNMVSGEYVNNGENQSNTQEQIMSQNILPGSRMNKAYSENRRDKTINKVIRSKVPYDSFETNKQRSLEVEYDEVGLLDQTRKNSLNGNNHELESEHDSNTSKRGSSEQHWKFKNDSSLELFTTFRKVKTNNINTALKSESKGQVGDQKNRLNKENITAVPISAYIKKTLEGTNMEVSQSNISTTVRKVPTDGKNKIELKHANTGSPSEVDDAVPVFNTLTNQLEMKNQLPVVRRPRAHASTKISSVNEDDIQHTRSQINESEKKDSNLSVSTTPHISNEMESTEPKDMVKNVKVTNTDDEKHLFIPENIIPSPEESLNTELFRDESKHKNRLPKAIQTPEKIAYKDNENNYEASMGDRSEETMNLKMEIPVRIIEQVKVDESDAVLNKQKPFKSDPKSDPKSEQSFEPLPFINHQEMQSPDETGTRQNELESELVQKHEVKQATKVAEPLKIKEKSSSSLNMVEQIVGNALDIGRVGLDLTPKTIPILESSTDYKSPHHNSHESSTFDGTSTIVNKALSIASLGMNIASDDSHSTDDQITTHSNSLDAVSKIVGNALSIASINHNVDNKEHQYEEYNDIETSSELFENQEKMTGRKIPDINNIGRNTNSIINSVGSLVQKTGQVVKKEKNEDVALEKLKIAHDIVKKAEDKIFQYTYDIVSSKSDEQSSEEETILTKKKPLKLEAKDDIMREEKHGSMPQGRLIRHTEDSSHMNHKVNHKTATSSVAEESTSIHTKNNFEDFKSHEVSDEENVSDPLVRKAKDTEHVGTLVSPETIQLSVTARVNLLKAELERRRLEALAALEARRIKLREELLRRRAELKLKSGAAALLRKRRHATQHFHTNNNKNTSTDDSKEQPEINGKKSSELDDNKDNNEYPHQRNWWEINVRTSGSNEEIPTKPESPMMNYFPNMNIMQSYNDELQSNMEQSDISKFGRFPFVMFFNIPSLLPIEFYPLKGFQGGNISDENGNNTTDRSTGINFSAPSTESAFSREPNDDNTLQGNYVHVKQIPIPLFIPRLILPQDPLLDHLYDMPVGENDIRLFHESEEAENESDENDIRELTRIQRRFAPPFPMFNDRELETNDSNEVLLLDFEILPSKTKITNIDSKVKTSNSNAKMGSPVRNKNEDMKNVMQDKINQDTDNLAPTRLKRSILNNFHDNTLHSTYERTGRDPWTEANINEKYKFNQKSKDQLVSTTEDDMKGIVHQYENGVVESRNNDKNKNEIYNLEPFLQTSQITYNDPLYETDFQLLQDHNLNLVHADEELDGKISEEDIPSAENRLKRTYDLNMKHNEVNNEVNFKTNEIIKHFRENHVQKDWNTQQSEDGIPVQENLNNEDAIKIKEIPYKIHKISSQKYKSPVYKNPWKDLHSISHKSTSNELPNASRNNLVENIENNFSHSDKDSGANIFSVNLEFPNKGENNKNSKLGKDVSISSEKVSGGLKQNEEINNMYTDYISDAEGESVHEDNLNNFLRKMRNTALHEKSPETVEIVPKIDQYTEHRDEIARENEESDGINDTEHSSKTGHIHKLIRTISDHVIGLLHKMAPWNVFNRS